MNQAEKEVQCFNDGFTCSQALLSIYGPQFGLDQKIALKLATPFGAGMGRMAKTCGAVTGAFMVLGLKFGRATLEDTEAKGKTYELVKEFADRFKVRNGSVVCKELIGYDIGIPEELEAAQDEDVFETLCPKLVKSAAELVEDMLSS
ncbi:C-GCAxxG-C-C family protein [Acidobacteriota bacterium]